MPIYEFKSELATPAPLVLPAATQSGDPLVKPTLLLPDDPYQASNSDAVRGFEFRAFNALDEAMKVYWSDLRVSHKDGYRFMRVKMAGVDKSVDIWRDDLKNGRVQLPVAAIDRTGNEHNKDKYSPSLVPMAVRYTSPARVKAILTYRPSPWLVDYTLLVWAASKRDLQYIHYQIETRFNSSLAEFHMSDGQIQGNVQLRWGGSTDATDKEVSAEDDTYYRWEFKMTAEAWLPLPEIEKPTMLGDVTVVKEDSVILTAATGQIVGL